jgi:radical SAM superfamily enzyme YgiQ (UPF0313 family)
MTYWLPPSPLRFLPREEMAWNDQLSELILLGVGSEDTLPIWSPVGRVSSTRGRRRTRETAEKATSRGPVPVWANRLVSTVRPRHAPPLTGHVPVSGSRLSSYRPGTKDSRGRILKRHFRGNFPRPQHAPVYFGTSSSRAARYRGISGRAQTLEAKRGVLRPRNVPF